jgi:hypothetical protein
MVLTASRCAATASSPGQPISRGTGPPGKRVELTSFSLAHEAAMRAPLLILLPAVLAGSVAGCAYPSAGPGRASDDLARLQSQCEARGGILVPSGANTGRPQLDQVCRISGAAAVRR